jgi:hypothetical protein
MEILNINEYDIDIKLEKKISDLLVESFGEIYPKDRIYYKQLPHFRFLAFDKDNLVGQVGLDYRVMNSKWCFSHKSKEHHRRLCQK